MTRDEAFLYIITQLNDRRGIGAPGIFDCGKLGFLYIWWGHHVWERRWFEPSNEFLKAIEEEL